MKDKKVYVYVCVRERERKKWDNLSNYTKCKAKKQLAKHLAAFENKTRYEFERGQSGVKKAKYIYEWK